MVVEQIFQIAKVRKQPSLISAVGFIFVCISTILAVMSHQPPMGFFIIALTVIPAIPFFIRMTICEERGEEILIKFISAIPPKKLENAKKGLSSLYSEIIKLYTYFFIGCVIGFAFTSSIMPEESSNLVFSDVKRLMISVMSSQALNPFNADFFEIFCHNFKLMLIMVVFSLIYSIGAVFLLVLNAAVIGLFLEAGIRSILPSFSSLGVLSYPAAFLIGSFQGILSLLPHGIWEFSAFFMASVAGGILSVAIERKAYKRTYIFKPLLIDVAKLLLLATLLLAVGAFVESSYSSLPSFLK
ncbi:MAG: stage II sporulation protein M [Candidatus Micrarchaeia archaeon]